MNLIREREREQHNLKLSLNSANTKDLGDSTQDSSHSKQDSPHSTPQTSLQNYKKLDYESLSDDEKSEGYVFHILSDFVSDDSRQKLSNLAKELSKIYPCEIKIHICDDSVFEGMPKWHNNYSAHLKILIAHFMPKDLNYCLYLDIDMFVFKDLRELWTLKLKDRVIGAVGDIAEFSVKCLYSTNPNGDDFYFGNFYFNSGFLFINLCEWRNQNIQNKALEFMSNYIVTSPDQDALNGAIKINQILILPIQYDLLAVAYNRFCNGNVAQYPKYQFLSYCENQVKFALENPVIVHFVGSSKAWCFDYCRLNTKGEILWFIWWKIAWNTPFFNDELKALFATKRDNYLVCKDFGLYVASLIDECTKSFVGYVKMPFIVYSAFRAFDLNRNYANDFSESLDKNVAFELLSIAVRAWGRKNKFERIAKFIILPFRIYHTKNRCKKGIFKAQKGNVISMLYV